MASWKGESLNDTEKRTFRLGLQECLHSMERDNVGNEDSEGLEGAGGQNIGQS